MIRRYLLAGLFTLLPLVVTIWILRWIFDALIGIFKAPLVLVYLSLRLPEPGYWAASERDRVEIALSGSSRAHSG